MTHLLYTLTEQFPRLFYFIDAYMPGLHDLLMQWYPNL